MSENDANQDSNNSNNSTSEKPSTPESNQNQQQLEDHHRQQQQQQQQLEDRHHQQQLEDRHHQQQLEDHHHQQQLEKQQQQLQELHIQQQRQIQQQQQQQPPPPQQIRILQPTTVIRRPVITIAGAIEERPEDQSTQEVIIREDHPTANNMTIQEEQVGVTYNAVYSQDSNYNMANMNEYDIAGDTAYIINDTMINYTTQEEINRQIGTYTELTSVGQAESDAIGYLQQQQQQQQQQDVPPSPIIYNHDPNLGSTQSTQVNY